MKRIVIVLLSALVLLVFVVSMIWFGKEQIARRKAVVDEAFFGYTDSSDKQNVCEEHSSEAAYSQWGACAICEAMQGKCFGTQCETWEDVVARTGFGKYSYELSVTDYDNGVSLDLTFEDSEQFSDNDWVCDFMCDSYLAFVGISCFAQNQSSVEVPGKFQKFAVIKLDFPGGSIVCTTGASYSPVGISTSLYVDEESPNKFMIERVYNLFFKSVN